MSSVTNLKPARAQIEDIYPLSSLQEGMLFHTLIAPGSDAYIVQVSIRFEGSLSVPALQRTWADAVARHPALRSVFVWDKARTAIQAVMADANLEWREEDWRAVLEAEAARRLDDYLADDRCRGFILDRAPLLRAALFRLGAQDYRFVLTFHHLLLDGWSVSLLFEEILERYRAARAGVASNLAPVRPYRDYIHWLQQRDATAAEVFWRQRLAGFISPTPIPGLLAVPETRPQVVEHDVVLDAGTTARLRAFARNQGLTLNTLVQGAWALLLARQGGEADVVFGATVAGRPAELAGVERMVGLFINTLPVRVRADGTSRLGPWLAALQADQLDCRQYEYAPLAKIQGWSDLPAGTALFDSLVVFENYPLATTFQQKVAEVSVTEVRDHERTNYPLTLLALPGEELVLRLCHDRVRLSDDAAQRLGRRIVTLLLAFPDNADTPIAALAFLDEQEKAQIARFALSDPTSDALSSRSLAEIFEAQVRRTPQAAALVAGTESLRYDDLNRAANRFARHLLAQGVHPGAIVGLALGSPQQTVLAILAIAKTGAAYLPLDVTLPERRLHWMLKDARPTIVLTMLRHRASLASCAITLCIDDPATAAAIEAQSCDDLGDIERGGHSQVDDLAYVIYTSGSTGEPKGVAVTHRGLDPLMASIGARTDGAGLGRKTVHALSFSFDASMLGLMTSILSGGTLFMGDTEPPDPGKLASLMATHGISCIGATPSILALLPADGLPALDIVQVGGEVLSLKLAAQWAPRGRLFNHFGPTEATISATIAGPLDGETLPTLGRPIGGARIYILDRYLAPVGVGMAGELYIGGAGVARGYVNRPGLTAERFLPDPFATPGARMYRTGDLARWRADGEIDYLGRLDDQVKIRGFRIELGEIEAALRRHPAVREAVVKAHTQPAPGGGERKMLVAYIVGDAGDGELRRYLAEQLPSYMVPQAYARLDALPLTANGKLDRKALPAASLGEARGSLAPRDATEATLVEIWQSVLDLAGIGVEDDFFELGGDSIISLQVVARARQAGLKLSARDLFQHRTIANLARTARPATAAATPIAGPTPLLPIHHLFFEQTRSKPDHFNQVAVLIVAPHTDTRALAHTFAALEKRHEMLRGRWQRSAEDWTHHIAEPAAIPPFETIDVVDSTDASLTTAVAEHGRRLQSTLSLADGPVWRAALFDRGGTLPGRLLIAIHHLAIDGVSWRVLLEELASGYQRIAAGKAPDWPPPSTPVAQWAHRLAAYAHTSEMTAEQAYWLRPRPAWPLPCDPSADTGGDDAPSEVATVTATLDPAVTAILLRQMPAAYSAEINELLLAALGRTIASWTGDDKLLVDLEGHGREDLFRDVDLSRTVGWFTSLYPVHLSLPRGADTAATIAAVRQQMRSIPQRGVGYGVLRYLGAPAVKALLAEAPRPQVLFNYLGQLDAMARLDPLLGWAAEDPGPDTAPSEPHSYELEINAQIRNGALQVEWTFVTGHHKPQTIRALADAFLERLVDIVRASPKAVTPKFPVTGLPVTDFAQATRPLVSVQPMGTRIPMFCVPGAAANASYLFPLGRALGKERPFLSFQCRGLEDDLEPHDSVDRMADDYVEAIRSNYPTGPLLLAGHSLGGLVALEMARRLQAAGRQIAGLIVLDTPIHDNAFPAGGQTSSDWDILQGLGRMMSRFMGIDLNLDWAALATKRPAHQRERVAEAMAAAGLLAPASAAADLARMVSVTRAHGAASAGYRGQPIEIGRIILCRASERSKTGLELFEPPGNDLPAWGWGRFTTRPVRDMTLPGNHVTMLRAPHVDRLAAALSAALDEFSI